MSLHLNLQSLSRLRAAALVFSLAAVAALPACAQEQAVASQPVVSSPNSGVETLELFSTSATAQQDDAVATERFSLMGGEHIGPNADASPQYGGGYGGPPRRRPYGRPTYRDRYSNADGSSKFAFEVGAGFATPAGSTSNYQKTGWDFSVGAGPRFNRALSVLLQYNYDNMGVSNAILNQFSSSVGQEIDGSSHLWSLTLNPTVDLSNAHSHYGAYVTFGGGFYRKVTTFTTPSSGYYCDPVYGFCYTVGTNETVAHFSNNAGGLNGGVGFYYKPSPEGNMKIFAEARYTWVDNSPNPNNGYPPNNYRTGYFPVKFGLRF